MMKTAETQLQHLPEEQRILYNKFTQMAKDGKKPTFRESLQLKKLLKDVTKINNTKKSE